MILIKKRWLRRSLSLSGLDKCQLENKQRKSKKVIIETRGNCMPCSLTVTPLKYFREVKFALTVTSLTYFREAKLTYSDLFDMCHGGQTN